MLSELALTGHTFHHWLRACRDQRCRVSNQSHNRMRLQKKLGQASRFRAFKKSPALNSCVLQLTRITTNHALRGVEIWPSDAAHRASAAHPKNVRKIRKVRMNFLLTRAEVTLVTGLGRTETFALQQQGKLRSKSNSACKSWFLLEDVLRCVAEVRGLPAPDQQSSELHARLVVSIRQKKKA